MKFVVVLLALVAYASALDFQTIVDAQGRSISSNIVDAIEAAKLQMPCGFPGLGVPPLAPLKMEHREINLRGGTFDMKAMLDKLRIYGLNEFDIVDFKVNAFLSKITFKFHWQNPHLKTIYDMWLKMHDSNLFSQLARDGHAKVALKDFVVWGTARYSLGVIGSGGLRLKELKLYASVKEVRSEIEELSNIKIVNRKLNEIIEEMIMLAINDNTDNFAVISNNMVVPIVNNLIGDKTLGDLLAMIGGGGGGGEGGEGGEPVVKEPCIPPPIEED